jgi:excisionase family DNA binding protein
MKKNTDYIHRDYSSDKKGHSALLDVNQAMGILCCSRGTVYNLIRGGDIRPIKVRSSTRFQRSEIERFISERAQQSLSNH